MNSVRIKLIVAALVVGSSVAYLAFAGAKSGYVYHMQVDQFLADSTHQNQRVRLCGKVAPDGFVSTPTAMTASFALVGTAKQVNVNYHGVVPEMFAANREVIVEGSLDSAGVFQADFMMTKCASKYTTKDGKQVQMGSGSAT